VEENVIVTINEVKISKTELDRGVKSLFPARYYHGTISDKQMEVFEKKVLEELVEDELLFQYATSIGIKISIADIDKSIDKLKKMLKSEEEFNETLKKSGFTLQTLKRSIEKEEVLKKFYREKIDVTLQEKDLKKYYNNNKYKFKEPEKIKVKVIYVKNDPTDPEGRSKAKMRIEEAYKKVKDGDDFGDVAAKYSTAMSRVKGGDLGYVHKGMLEPAVEAVAFTMDANSTSEIIEEDIGFFIVKLDSKYESKQLSFDSVKDKLKKDLKKKFEKEKKEKLLEKLMAKAIIIK
jgi:parvulin-like peptidyl-prolyl isomerase